MDTLLNIDIASPDSIIKKMCTQAATTSLPELPTKLERKRKLKLDNVPETTDEELRIFFQKFENNKRKPVIFSGLPAYENEFYNARASLFPIKLTKMFNLALSGCSRFPDSITESSTLMRNEMLK